MEQELTKTSEKNNSKQKDILRLAVIGFALALILGGFYLYLASSRINIENCFVEAPIVALSPKNGGTLEKIYVNEGDTVQENQVVAEVGQELVKTTDAGIIVKADNSIGNFFAPGSPVVSMIKPTDLEVVAQVDEDKGLTDIQVGQAAFFTVDAYGAKQYQGIVDEVAPSSRQSDVVFNISSQRQVKQFNVKIRFDSSRYPELKNGMSAKAWIFKK